MKFEKDKFLNIYNNLVEKLESFKEIHKGEINQYNKKYIKTLIEIIVNNKLKLIIMGQDPYPTGAMKIPFCKKNWESLKGLSGDVIFEELIKDPPSKKKTPRIQAMELLRDGVVFLNSCYACSNDKETKDCQTTELKEIQSLSDEFNRIILGNVDNFDQIVCIGTKARDSVAKLRLTTTHHTSKQSKLNPSKYAVDISDLDLKKKY